ncbi:MAG: transposase [Pseudomonadota bacterium]
MTEVKIAPLIPIVKLIPHIPDTDLSFLISDALALGHANPAILEAIDLDRDVVALEKKRVRMEDKQWLRSHGQHGLGLEDDESLEGLSVVELGVGRDRMPALVVLVFLSLRGYFGGYKDSKTATTLAESRTLEILFVNFGMKMPGASTILDNINAVTPATLDLILDAQIKLATFEKLDDFKELVFDSTHCAGNTAWPTDSGTIAGLSIRGEHLLRSLANHGIRIKMPAVQQSMQETIEEIHKNIQLSAGKKDSAKKRGVLYRKQMRIARKVRKQLDKGHQRAKEKLAGLRIMPSQQRTITKILEWAAEDIKNLGLAITNADKRINKDVKVDIKNKIVSTSDKDASMIVKGQRDPVVGYKPQIGRSEKGFITSIIVPEGNAADSSQLRPVVDSSIKRTGVTPSVLSFDDGYANAKDRKHYLGIGVGVVSFSGSKGKKIIPEKHYNSPAYQKARQNRSAVESLMFTLKHNHDLDQMMRRGIDNVRAEILEKSIAYNFFRLRKIRNDRAKEEASKLAA